MQKLLSCISDVFEKYENALDAVPGIQFDEFKSQWSSKSIRMASNHAFGFLLSCIGMNQPLGFEVDKYCDRLFLLATSGVGITHAQFQYLSNHFGFFGMKLRLVWLSFYKDRNGLVPDRFKDSAENMKNQIGDNVDVESLYAMYSYRGEGACSCK
jgi:hypothetical protein